MTDDFTQASRENWNKVAEGWEQSADFVARNFVPIQSWLMDHLDPRPGETVLELGAGPGDAGFEAARRIGSDGLLISSDLSPAMVEAAQRRARRLGVDNADFRVMDAQRIDLDDDSVDGIVHRCGPMLLPDPTASFAAARRVLRSGGRYTAAVWAKADVNPWLAMMAATVPPHPDHASFDPAGPGGPYSLADPEMFERRLLDAGFTDVSIEEVDSPMKANDFDELWLMPSKLGGTATAIKQMTRDELAAAKDRLREAAETHRDGDGYVLGATALCALAR